MGLTYIYSESTVMPDEIEVCKSTVYFRKDITKEERMIDEENMQTFYTYQEAKMPIEQFHEYSTQQAAINAVKGTNDSANISNLLIGQENGDNNQLIIMEAIADLYDAIASLM